MSRRLGNLANRPVGCRRRRQRADIQQLDVASVASRCRSIQSRIALALRQLLVRRAAPRDQVAAADEFLEAAIAHARQQLAHFLSHEQKISHHMLGLAFELGAQLRALRGDTGRARVQVTHARHDATLGDQRSSAEGKFFRTQQHADQHVAPGADAAVGAHTDAAAQIVVHQRLLRLRQANLPRHSCVLD